MSNKVNKEIARALWKIYHRFDRPLPWAEGVDFPWDDPFFAQRALNEHLDESHGAASRSTTERNSQINWLWQQLGLRPDLHLFDITCGPGLYAVEFARRGCRVTGLDINPASVTHARHLAARWQVSDWCTFIEQDVRQMRPYQAEFDAAIFLYEQLAVFAREEAQQLLARICQALKPGGRLCVDLLDQAKIDKSDNTWWFTDNSGLWGDEPFLHLGERSWNDEDQSSIEQYYILHLETGELKEYAIFDQTYSVEAMVSMLKQAGFASVESYPAWAGLPLYDAAEWVAYVAQKG